MALIKDRERKLLANEFQALTGNVNLVLFTRNEDCDMCDQTRELVQELASLSPKLAMQVYDLDSDPEQVRQFGVDKAPALVVMNGKDYGIRYYGMPAGYEFGSLVEDILDVSKGDSGLLPATRAALADLKQPVHFQVFVTPSCPYCPQAVRTAHRMAMESPLVRADMVEATEFPELSERYDVMAVPRVVINDTSYFEGSLPEAQYLAAALQAIGAPQEA